MLKHAHKARAICLQITQAEWRKFRLHSYAVRCPTQVDGVGLGHRPRLGIIEHLRWNLDFNGLLICKRHSLFVLRGIISNLLL